MRPATPADIPAMRALWQAHVAGSMFPLVNLRDHGLGGHHPRSLHCWIALDGGVLAVTNEGIVMPQLPDATPDTWAAAARILRGRPLIGALGDAGQVRGFLAAAGLTGGPFRHDADEPAFSLDLSRLVVPPGPGLLRPPTDADLPRLIDWRTAYHRETLGTPEDAARATATRDMASYLDRASHRLLQHDGQPLSFTGFNAALDTAVQIGGVYTPPGLRRRGHARRAVALHLAEARAAGATRAFLFAASDMAAHAYRAIGFEPRGRFSVTLFDKPQVIA